MNSNQLPNDVYQMPQRSGESFGVQPKHMDPVFDENKVERETHAVEREAVQRALLTPEVEVSPMHSIIMQILNNGRGIKEYRAQQHIELTKKTGFKTSVEHILERLISNSTDVPTAKVEKSIDQDSAIGNELFPTEDKDVTGKKFFVFPELDPQTREEMYVWYYNQESSKPAKNFTLSYKVSENHIEKSATYYDEQVAAVVNRSSIPSEIEAYNLMIASSKCYTAVTEKPYIRSAAPRLRLGSKSDHDLAA